jgi:DNA-binding CsgD family transcriptional regulator
MKIFRSHPTFLYANDLEQICQPLKSLGIDYFSHVMIDEKGNFSAIGTCPLFAELYFKKEYYNFDIHRSPQHQNQNYIIWDNVARDPKLNDVYDDFKSFSLGHSFTIFYQDLNGCKHYYDFSATLGNGSINHTYLRNIDSLKFFILYFAEQINKNQNLKKAYDVKFLMNNYEKNNSPYENKNKLSLPINRIYFSRDIYLTLREFECLEWLSRGNTFEEISLILSITQRTMKAHVSSIKNKLGCNSLFQLGLVYQAWKENNMQNSNFIAVLNNVK